MNSLSRGLSYLGFALAASGGGFVALAAAPAGFAAEIPMSRDTLKDGTKVEIQGDRLYQWLRGKRTLAKDGTYTLQSGKTITVKNGRMITETGKTEFPNLKK